MVELRHDLIRMSDIYYTIKSQTTSRQYDLDELEGVWHCSCPDHTYRNKNCLHLKILHQEIGYTNQRRIRHKIELSPLFVNGISCKACKSHQIVKNGNRITRWGKIQRYVCKCCKKSFCNNIGFEYAKKNPRAIVTALQLYFSGESLRSTARTIGIMNLGDVSHQTIYNWIKLYIKKIEKYLDSTITPQVGHDSWRADEIYLKISGNLKYLFIMMDDETRFIIAQEVADRKEGHDASKLLQKAKAVTNTKPRAFITDGLGSYHTAYRKEFFTIKRAGRTIHLRHIHLRGDMNNNKMERLNGEIRDREKVMRGLQSDHSPIITGYKIFHNYIRPHGGIGNITPAEKCGIIIHGKNKWETLIQNATTRSK